MKRWTPWVGRIGWLLVAVVGGAAVNDAIDERSNAVTLVAAVGGWTIWGLVALALLIPSVRSLTIVRLLAPLALVATLAAALAGAGTPEVVGLLLTASLSVAAIFTAEFGHWMVQASAYGDEYRNILRPPVAAATAAVIAWLLWAGCLVVGPLALAGTRWVIGAVLTALAVAGWILLGPRWHRLSQRWLVFVPAGLVVHDPVVLADTIMLRTPQVAHLRLAPADTEAADLTGPTSGHVLEVATTETVTTVLAFTPQEPNGRAIHLTAMLVAPSRPGTALAVADDRGLPVG
jgi:hypothetical protein